MTNVTNTKIISGQANEQNKKNESHFSVSIQISEAFCKIARDEKYPLILPKTVGPFSSRK